MRDALANQHGVEMQQFEVADGSRCGGLHDEVPGDVVGVEGKASVCAPDKAVCAGACCEPFGEDGACISSETGEADERDGESGGDVRPS